MKWKAIILLACGALAVAGVVFNLKGQEARGVPKEVVNTPAIEYGSVRFMEENTSIVWPDGTVENVMILSGKQTFNNKGEKYPKGADYRMYWLTVAMNIMGRRGFEFVHMNGPDVIMKRQVSR